MSSLKGSSYNVLRLGIIIITLLKLTDCDYVTGAPQNVYQRDKPYVNNEIPEPELLPVLHGNDTRCRISEYHCANKKCIPINRFCDGANDCGDSSDELRHCTRCNRTYYGDIGRTYELELHRPREDLVPYVCLLTVTAAGGIHGDLVQVLFDSFTLGRFTSFTEDGCPDGYMQIQEASRPQVGGSWCGTSWGPSIYYSETKSITLIIRLLHLSKEQNNYNFDFRMAYKVLRKEYATVRYGGSPPSERPFFKLRPLSPILNISRNEETNVRSKNFEYYLGDLISGTYCSRIFSDCDRKKCRLQSPNYPGVYPRNLTCYYAVRQHEVPQGKHALIIVRQPNGQLISIRSQKALYATAQQERGNNGRELKFWQQCDEVQDYVTVYDGYTTRDPVILRFCGGGVAVPEAVSSGPELLVEFTTSPFGTFLQPATLQSLHGFQLEVEVRFVDQQSPTYAKNKRACEFWIRGTGKGVLEHPQHSLPPNTTCLYHMQGIDTSGPSGRNIIYRRPSFSAPRFRVWFSVLKFYVTNALNPNLPEDEYCGSHLNIWDGPMRISPGCSDIFCDRERSVQMSRATSPQSVIVGRPPTNATLIARFCRERAPRTCEHALLRKSRACTRTESFLSKGDSLTLELKLTQGTALKPVFFKALYEFVDLHQDGEPWGRGSCSRRFSSRSFPEAPPDPPVSFSSPRDVFLYGRGGKKISGSCTYRFEANPGEVIRLRVWGIRSGGRLCRSVHSAHSPWYRCGGDMTAALRIFERPWRDNGPGVPRDCLCSDVGDYEFTSKTTLAELKFDVVNMSATDDFRSFGFEASIEFIRQEVLCENTHRAFGASGELKLSSSSNSDMDRCEFRPWLIDPSPGRYLYLQIRGSIIKEPELDNFTLLNNITVAPDLRHMCRTPNRIAVYAGGLTPIFICPEPPEQPDDIVEIFSDGWSQEVDPLARHVLAPPPSPDHFDLDWPRSLSVELLAEESGSYFVTWLELSRRHASERGGVFALSGECQYRCASLDACISPALWCDGVVQCPQGEDERLSECSALLRVPAHYAAAFLALTILTVFAVIAAARSCRRRRSALQHRLKSLSSDTAIFEEKEVIC